MVAHELFYTSNTFIYLFYLDTVMFECCMPQANYSLFFPPPLAILVCIVLKLILCLLDRFSTKKKKQ